MTVSKTKTKHVHLTIQPNHITNGDKNNQLKKNELLNFVLTAFYCQLTEFDCR